MKLMADYTILQKIAKISELEHTEISVVQFHVFWHQPRKFVILAM